MKLVAVSAPMVAVLLAACSDNGSQLRTKAGEYYAAELATMIANANQTALAETCSEIKDLIVSEREFLGDAPDKDPTTLAAERTQVISALETIEGRPVSVSTPTQEQAIAIAIGDKTLESEFREEIPDLERLAKVCDDFGSGLDSSAQEELEDLLGTEAD